MDGRLVRPMMVATAPTPASRKITTPPGTTLAECSRKAATDGPSAR
jgi:hypothetical protein